MKKIKVEDIYNCILGGVIGDALGYPVRDLEYDIIIKNYGKSGIDKIELDCDNRARITDNTQLTIFTIDALIRTYTKYYLYNKTGMGVINTYTAYLRWQYNQGRKIPNTRDIDFLNDNYLMNYQELKYERCAENYTKEILCNEIQKDKLEGTNDNKGYLCLTKTAPIGLVFYKDDEDAFEMAVKIAKITHGHPSAYISCGILSVIIANLLKGENLNDSIQKALNIARNKKDSKEVIQKINFAYRMSKDKYHYAEKLDDFGLCDKADDLLAAAIYICLIFEDKDISDALIFSVNNNCLSNNIASVVGNILGLYKGLDIISTQWSKKIELYDLYKSLSFDLYCTAINELPQEIENFDKELTFDEIKYNNEYNIANWWMVKYDKD